MSSASIKFWLCRVEWKIWKTNRREHEKGGNRVYFVSVVFSLFTILLRSVFDSVSKGDIRYHSFQRMEMMNLHNMKSIYKYCRWIRLLLLVHLMLCSSGLSLSWLDNFLLFAYVCVYVYSILFCFRLVTWNLNCVCVVCVCVCESSKLRM